MPTGDVTKSPYAGWLEELISNLLEMKPDKIGIAAILPNGEVLTGYYGGCGHVDKVIMAHNIHLDSVMDVVKANARSILEAAEEEDDADT